MSFLLGKVFEIYLKNIRCSSLKDGTKKEQRQIELLKILAKGCKKHPAYRAIRKATERCEECVVVWQAKVELNKLIKLWEIKKLFFCRKKFSSVNIKLNVGNSLC